MANYIEENVSALGNSIYSLLSYRVVNFAATWVFSRTAIHGHTEESIYTRLGYGLAVGASSTINDYLIEKEYVDNYAFTYGTLAASYIYPQGMVASTVLNAGFSLLSGAAISKSLHVAVESSYSDELMVGATSAGLAYYGYKILPNHKYLSASVGFGLSIAFSKQTLEYLLPITETKEAYATLKEYMNLQELDTHIMDLTAITLNIQLGISYIGISYVTHVTNKDIFLLASTTPEKATSFKTQAIEFIIHDASNCQLLPAKAG